MGDGSFGMCVGELETAVRLKLPITCIVISNAVYGWIKAGQKSGYGERYFSVDFGVTDHAKVADAFGVRSWRVSDPRELDPVLKQAIAYGGAITTWAACPRRRSNPLSTTTKSGSAGWTRSWCCASGLRERSAAGSPS